jgi:hypothetical protein
MSRSWDAPQANETNLAGFTFTTVRDEFGFRFVGRAVICDYIFCPCDNLVPAHAPVHEQVRVARRDSETSIGVRADRASRVVSLWSWAAEKKKMPACAGILSVQVHSGVYLRPTTFW